MTFMLNLYEQKYKHSLYSLFLRTHLSRHCFPKEKCIADFSKIACLEKRQSQDGRSLKVEYLPVQIIY